MVVGTLTAINESYEPFDPALRHRLRSSPRPTESHRSATMACRIQEVADARIRGRDHQGERAIGVISGLLFVDADGMVAVVE